MFIMTNNTYKYWFFYIKPDYLDMVTTESSDSLLYAYTDNEEYANLFMTQRDMNKFFIKKRKIEKDEVNYLANEFTREYLIKKDIKTKSSGIGSKIIDYSLIITRTEDCLIQSNAHKIIMVDLWITCTSFNPYSLSSKYIKLLNEIGFIDRFNIMNNTKHARNNIDKMGDNIHPDYLSTFIRYFGFLLSTKTER